MRRDPAATARAAFAMAARAELLDGQRAAALNRGLALVEKFALDPDDFDIPGRKPSRSRVDESAFADYDHDRPPGGMTGTSWRRERLWTVDEIRADMGLSPFEQAINEFRERAAARAEAAAIFRQTQSEMQTAIRAEATALGRGRIRILRPDDV